MEFIKLAFNNLLRRKLRTFLTILGIAVAISFVIGVLSISEGFIVSLKDIAEKGGEDLIVVSSEQPFAFMAIGGMAETLLPEDILPKLAAQEAVKGVYPVLVEHLFFEEGPHPFMPFHLYGVTPEYFTQLRPHLKVEGRFFDPQEQALVLSPDVAKQLNAQIGKKIYIKGEKLEVVGILEKVEAMALNNIYLPINTLQKVYNAQGKISFVFLKLEDPAKADKVAKAINQNLKEVWAITKEESISQGLDILRTAQAMHFSYTFIAVIISSLFILSTMIMSVSERSREVGTLRAIGISRWLILRLILYESLLLALFGGAVGILGGMGLGQGIKFALDKAFGLGGFVQPAVTLKLFVLALTLSFLIGIIGGLYPAWRLSRINIIQALKYE